MSFEFKEITILNKSNKSLTMRVNGTRLLSEKNNHGDIYEVYGEVSKVQQSSQPKNNSKKIHMVVKEFYNPKHSKRALENFELIKKITKKTYTTFRECENGCLILSNLNDNDRVAVSSNNSSVAKDHFKENRIDTFIGFPQMASEIFDLQMDFAENYIEIWRSSYFFMLEKKSKSTIDFILGDIDKLSVWERGNSIDRENLFMINLTCAEFAMKILLRQVCANVESYYAIIDEIKRDKIKQYSPLTNLT